MSFAEVELGRRWRRGVSSERPTMPVFVKRVLGGQRTGKGTKFGAQKSRQARLGWGRSIRRRSGVPQISFTTPNQNAPHLLGLGVLGEILSSQGQGKGRIVGERMGRLGTSVLLALVALLVSLLFLPATRFSYMLAIICGTQNLLLHLGYHAAPSLATYLSFLTESIP